jgi:hypothetical protein
MTATELLEAKRAGWQQLGDDALVHEIAMWIGTPEGEALLLLAVERGLRLVDYPHGDLGRA